jgi:hypothetical protein
VSPYDVLGVPASARPEECRAAYRRLLTEHHPDRWVDAPAPVRAEHAARLQAVTAAWMDLLDLERRTPKEHIADVVPPMEPLEGWLDDLEESPTSWAGEHAVAPPRPGVALLPALLLALAVVCFCVSVVLSITALWQLAVALALAAMASFALVPFFMMLRGRR